MAGATFKMDMGVLQRATGQALALMRNRQTLAEDIGEMLVSSVQERFEGGAGPDGEKWKPSERAQKKRAQKKRAQKKGGQTLVDSGRLKNSVGYEAGPDAVAVGTNVVYAAIHQYGGKAGRGKRTKLPARPYLGMSEDDLREARAMIKDFMVQGFAR